MVVLIDFFGVNVDCMMVFRVVFFFIMRLFLLFRVLTMNDVCLFVIVFVEFVLVILYFGMYICVVVVCIENGYLMIVLLFKVVMSECEFILGYIILAR